MMKKIFSIIVCTLATLSLSAQGWPAQYDGVMLQGFYWDSYSDSKWTNLTSQADELSQYFKLIWVPNSGKTSDFYHNNNSKTMGYDPCFWLDHTSCWGTETELKTMIQTFKAKGTGFIADVVINHKNGRDTWVDFPNETKGSYSITWDNTDLSDICQNDECNSHLSEWATGAYSGKKATGAEDTGDNFDGYRDLDHTNAQVQQNVKTYLDYLIKELGYAGFRYDMVAGYKAQYTGEYNASAQPTYSVGEYWKDNGKSGIVNWINGTKVDGVIQSAAFDFITKWNINDAFKSEGNWSKLNNAALANDASYARYAVTFVDNHDTGRPSSSPLYANVEAANAYILTMPGTPCVWLKHWQTYKTTIKRLIATRRAVGLHNQSAIITQQAKSNGYILITQGLKGNAVLLLGSLTESDLPTGSYKLAVKGTCFQLYVTTDVDLSEVEAIKDVTFDAPDCCVVNDGEVCAFFEAPTSWTTVKAYAWNGSAEFCGSWPGIACTKVGTNNGHNVWKWTYNGTWTFEPAHIIFNDGKQNNASQTSDLDFRNGGYYDESGALQGVVTDIASDIRTDQRPYPARIYTLDGRQVSNTPNQLPRGIYIVGGRKVIK